MLFLLEAECSKIHKKTYSFGIWLLHLLTVEMWYSFVSIITLALPTCRILFNSTYTVPVLFVLLMRNSSAFVFSVQFQHNVLWQQALSGPCTICNHRGAAASAGNFCSAQLPFPLSGAMGNVYFANTSTSDISSGQCCHIEQQHWAGTGALSHSSPPSLNLLKPQILIFLPANIWPMCLKIFFK